MMFPVARRNWQAVNGGHGLAPLAEVERAFDRFFGADGSFSPQVKSRTPLSIWEDADRFHVEADLPGVADGDVEVTVHKGVLSIRGERKAPEGRTYIYQGRTAGKFDWTVNLPETVSGDQVVATLSGGVLHVELTKITEAQPKKINIQVQ